MKIRDKVNEIQTKITIPRKKIKNWFFEKLKNIDKPLPNLTKMRWE
jgi:hypothetical protein